MSSQLPILIVGQGLAGSLLAFELLKHGRKIRIIEDNVHPSASKVAAGIYHPLIGQKMVKTWLADEAIPFAISTYRKLETLLKKNFLVEMPFYELLESAGDMNDWDTKTENFRHAFIEDDLATHLPKILRDKRSRILKQNYSGYLDTVYFLDTCKNHFEDLGIQSEETFTGSDLGFQEDCISYKNQMYSAVIFCTGSSIRDESHFAFLPMKATKGETILVRCPNLDLDGILHQSIFIQPLGDGLFRLGSTFHWTWENVIPDEESVQIILNKFRSITGLEPEFISAMAGIRPSSHDRRPYMGEHPHKKHIYVFSGLGTKGVLLGPLMAENMADMLVLGKELHPEADIKRLKKYYPAT